MASIQNEEVRARKEFLVRKDNRLIQANRNSLSLMELKTMAYICTMIYEVQKTRTPDDIALKIPFQREYIFDTQEYCKTCDIDHENGKNYRDVKATLKKLSDRSMWVDTGEKEILMRWLSYAEIDKKGGKILVEVGRTMIDYLVDLTRNFTKYQLWCVLKMKSNYSFRIYELCKSWQWLDGKTKTYDLDELKCLLMVDKIKSYDDFYDFKKRVLDKAQKDINELTDIKIYIEPISKGRKVVKVKFRIEDNPQDNNPNHRARRPINLTVAEE
jgi:plasmid replication initiation protein